MASRTPTLKTLVIRLILIVVLLLGGIYWLWFWLHNPISQPIACVKIHASYAHISPEKIQEYIQPHVQKGFYVSDAEELQQQLAHLPWTKSVTVQRLWPDTLLVRLQEREPVAKWGDHGLIDQQSELFYPDLETMPQALPVLRGPTVMAPKILATYYQMLQILASQDLDITEVSVSPRRSWALKLSNGFEVELGREQQMLRLKRFVKVFPKLAKQHIHRIDMRYPNGFAVR